MDDIIIICKDTMEELNIFNEYIHNLAKHKFTIELELNNKINFLNLTLIRNTLNNRINYEIYRKPTTTIASFLSKRFMQLQLKN